MGNNDLIEPFLLYDCRHLVFGNTNHDVRPGIGTTGIGLLSTSSIGQLIATSNNLLVTSCVDKLITNSLSISVKVFLKILAGIHLLFKTRQKVEN